MLMTTTKDSIIIVVVSVRGVRVQLFHVVARAGPGCQHEELLSLMRPLLINVAAASTSLMMVTTGQQQQQGESFARRIRNTQ